MTGLATTDLVIDHAVAQVGGAIQFLLDVTPVNSDLSWTSLVPSMEGGE